MSRIRKNGCCAVCDVELWEAVSRWTTGPFEGEMRRMKPPSLPGARRVTVLQVWTGSTVDISLCKDCELTPENMPEVWRAILLRDAMERDPEIRKMMSKVPVPELSPEKQEFARKIQRVQEMDLPIGVLRTQRLEELYG